MRINNKGMAISGILYSLLILFIILVLSILALMATSKSTLDKVKNKVLNDLNSPITAKITMTADKTGPVEFGNSVYVTVTFQPIGNKQSDWIYEYLIDDGKTWIEVGDTYIHEFIENGIIKARIRTEKSILVENSYKVSNILEPILVAGNTGGTTETSRYLTTDTNQTLLRNKIESIEFVNHITVPGTAVGSYDVSTSKNGSVMLWYTAGTGSLYKVYIGSEGMVRANANLSYLFSDLISLKNLDLTYLDTSRTTDMSHMFQYFNCFGVIIKTNGVNGINFDTSKVTDMSYMFYNTSLSTIEFGPNFVTNNVTSMSLMFSNFNSTSVTTIKHTGGANNVINFDTSNVTSMSGMFSKISLSTIEFGPNFVTSNVTTMGSMFKDSPSLTMIKHTGGANNVINFDTSKVTIIGDMFYDASFSTIEFGSNFVTSNVTNMSNMFSNMTNLTTITTGGKANYINWDTSKAIDMSYMFRSTKLSSIEFGSNFVTNNVTNMKYMFYNMTNLTTITTDGKANYINWDTSKVTLMDSMIYSTKLPSIEFSPNFVTNNVTSMSFMFYNMTNLTTITTDGKANYINWDTSKVTDIQSMFSSSNTYNTNGLSSIEFGSKFVTSNVTNMSNMFSNMANLTTIITPAGTNKINWNTLKVTTMSSMFSSTELSSIEFGSSFVTSNVTSMSSMFNNMANLTTIITPAGTNKINFDTSKVTDVLSMFSNTKLSSIEFGSSFVTSNVTRMNSMFYNMANLTTIITPAGTNKINFDTSKVTDVQSMFSNTKLPSIEFGSSFVTNNVTNMSKMFSGMPNLNSTAGLDLRYFDFTKVTTYTSMFGDTTPTTAKITLNTAGNSWFTPKFPTYTNITVVP